MDFLLHFKVRDKIDVIGGGASASTAVTVGTDSTGPTVVRNNNNKQFIFVCSKIGLVWVGAEVPVNLR